MAITWGAAGVFGSIGKAIKEANAAVLGVADMGTKSLAFVKAYVQHNYAYDTRTTVTAYADILELMIAEMEDDSETVNGNAVTYGSEVFEGSALGDTMTGLAATQMMVDDDTITLECTSVSVGKDTWTIKSMLRGSSNQRAITGTAYPPTDAQDTVGLEFTIGAPAAVVYNDGSAIIGDADTLSGGVLSSNCDANGKVWCKVEEAAGTYTMTIYPTEGDRTGDSNAVATLVYTAIGSAIIVEENSSGLGGTVTIDTLATDAGLEIKLNIPYALGDTYTIGDTTSDDLGVIQTYFRDSVGRALPFDLVGGETIPDTLAQ